MKPNLVMVFSKENRDSLIANGYILLQSDDQNSIFTLCADGMNTQIFDLSNMEYVHSNTLTF